MAHRADSANARGDLRHFEIQTPFAEFLETAELIDMHVSMFNGSILFYMDGDLGVAFNPGYGLNGNFLCGHRFFPQPNASGAIRF